MNRRVRQVETREGDPVETHSAQNDDAAIPWRVAKLEEGHDRMAEAQQAMADKMNDLIVEFRVARKLIALVVAGVGIAQPLMFYFLNR